jgi:filamentous hemagglutinin
MRQEIQPTLDRINNGISDPHFRDGEVWANRDGDLPQQPYGYYHEYVHHPTGIMDIPGDISRGPAGAMRIITGDGGEVYFSPYHYGLVLFRLY